MTSSIGASKEAIQSHYDLSNDFYHLWLDDLTKSYSAALFGDSDTFESAQLRKIDHHINSSKAQEASRVLDIGCGWGGTLVRVLERNPSAQCVGLTLSNAQKEFVEQLGLSNTDVFLETWEKHKPKSNYDSIISIGAFEHFANLEQTASEKIHGYRKFFEKCHSWLNESAFLSLQTISYENSSRADFSDFFEKEIFPESDLPRIHEMAAASDGLFEIVNLRNDREDYYLTQREWWRALKQNKARIITEYGELVYDRYNKYLQMCMMGFKNGAMGLIRVTYRRIDQPNPSIAIGL